MKHPNIAFTQPETPLQLVWKYLHDLEQVYERWHKITQKNTEELNSYLTQKDNPEAKYTAFSTEIERTIRDKLVQTPKEYNYSFIIRVFTLLEIFTSNLIRILPKQNVHTGKHRVSKIELNFRKIVNFLESELPFGYNEAFSRIFLMNKVRNVLVHEYGAVHDANLKERLSNMNGFRFDIADNLFIENHAIFEFYLVLEVTGGYMRNCFSKRFPKERILPLY